MSVRAVETPAKMDMTPLWAAVALVCGLLALINLLTAPLANLVLYGAISLAAFLARSLLFIPTPHPRTCLALLTGLLIAVWGLLRPIAPSFLFITGWTVWGLYVLLLCFCILAWCAGWSRILLVDDSNKRPGRFWAGVLLVVLILLGCTLYTTYIFV